MGSALKQTIMVPIYLGLFHLFFIIMMGIFANYQAVKGADQVPFMYASRFLICTIVFTHSFIICNVVVVVLDVVSVHGRA